MKKLELQILIYAFSILFSSSAIAQKTDIIYFPNGDHLVGEIKNLDKGLLSLSTKYMGTEDIEWNDIVRIITDKVFILQTRDGKIYKGTFRFESLNNVEIITADTTIVTNADFLVRVLMVDRQIWDRFDGELGFGLDFTKANSILNLNGNGELIYRDLKYIVGTSLESVFTMVRKDDERYNRLNVELEGMRILQKSLLVSMRYSFEKNSELGFDSRHLIGGGIASNALRTQHVDLIFKAGLSYNRELFTSDTETTQQASDHLEMPLVARFKAFAHDTPQMDVEIGFEYNAGLSDWGRHRLTSNISLAFEFVEDFWLKFTFYDEYDTRTPDTGNSSNDYGFISSIAYYL